MTSQYVEVDANICFVVTLMSILFSILQNLYSKLQKYFWNLGNVFEMPVQLKRMCDLCTCEDLKDFFASKASKLDDSPTRRGD